MRPLKLEFSGLGPFPTKNEVDFTTLSKDGIFLISGPTGSGKTTIFDAISYALYGEVSGSERTKENLRSDFALPEVKTYVKLSFVHKEKEYQVERIPKYERPKLRGEGMVVTKEEATLELPDGRVVTGFSGVNEAMRDILGVDYRQFKQLSMLAQGEFQQLLVANSNERVQIFRSIFQTQIYQRIQGLAKDKARILYGELRELLTKMEEASRVEVASEEYQEAYEKHDFGQMIDLLKAESTGQKKLYEALEEEISAARTKQAEQVQEYRVRKQKKIDLEALMIQKEELESRLPLFQQQVKEDEREEEYLTKELPNKKKQEEQLVRLEEVKKQIQKYQILQKKKADLLDNIKKQKVKIEIARYNEWKKEQDKLHVLEKKIQEKQDEFKQADEKFKIEKEGWMQLQSKYFAANVGMLATRLEEGKPCPVCGATTHPNPAKTDHNTVTKEEVEKQKKVSEKAEELYQDIYQVLLELTEKKKAYESTISMTPPELELTSVEEASRSSICDAKKEEDGLQQIKEQYQGLKGEEHVLKAQIQDTEDVTSVDIRYQELKNAIETFEKRQQKHQKNSQTHHMEVSNCQVRLEEVKKQVKAIGTSSVTQEELEEREHILKVEELRIGEKEKEKEFMRVSYQQEIRALTSLKEKQKKRLELEEQYGIVGDVNRLLNGDNSLRLTFEQYVLITYFQDILQAANQRLLKMTNGRYEMYRQEEIKDARKKDNLEIVVLDYYTGKKRSVKTLSGGESFKAALCLALGLSDIVQNNVGGIEIDILFVDEGFGSLDQESLDQAVDVLMELASGRKMVGIISHVSELKNRISKQIQIIKKNNGSKVEE